MPDTDAPQVEPLTLTLEEARRRYEAASAELSQLCQGRRFRMTIPVRPDDSDTILGEALQALRALTEGHDLVPRDPAAELVEALEQAYRLLSDNYDSPLDFVEGITSAKHILDAALARVKGDT